MTLPVNPNQPSGRIAKTTTVDSYKLPVLGKIKVGKKIENKNGKQYPTSLDYFVVNEDSMYASKFYEAFGETPNTIGIVFASNNIKDVCNERYECRNSAGKLVGTGDGKSFSVWNDEQKKYLPYSPETPGEREGMKNWGTWKTVLTITFIIPKINKVIGVWMFTTSGVHSSIPAIRDTFDKILADAGTVTGIPFDLVVKKVKSQKPGDNNTFPVVSLIPNVSHEKLEDIRNFITTGGQLRDIKKVLEGESNTPLQLPGADLPVGDDWQPEGNTEDNQSQSSGLFNS